MTIYRWPNSFSSIIRLRYFHPIYSHLAVGPRDADDSNWGSHIRLLSFEANKEAKKVPRPALYELSLLSAVSSSI